MLIFFNFFYSVAGITLLINFFSYLVFDGDGVFRQSFVITNTQCKYKTLAQNQTRYKYKENCFTDSERSNCCLNCVQNKYFCVFHSTQCKIYNMVQVRYCQSYQKLANLNHTQNDHYYVFNVFFTRDVILCICGSSVNKHAVKCVNHNNKSVFYFKDLCETEILHIIKFKDDDV